MILVVADSSPLIVLLKIGQIDLLPTLFNRAAMPPAIAEDLTSDRRTKAVRDFFDPPPAWLRVQQPRTEENIPGLYRGASQAFAIATELNAHLVFVDETRAYHEAVGRHLPAIGTIAVLERAAAMGLLDLKEAFELLKSTDFRISHDLLALRLRAHLARKQPAA